MKQLFKRRLLNTSKYSFCGLSWAFKNEEAFRIECLMFIVLFPAAFFVGDTVLERLMLIGSLGVVLIVEVLNTAVEIVVDRISEEQHVLSGRAKDLGSAAVFLSLMLVVGVWLTIFLN